MQRNNTLLFTSTFCAKDNIHNRTCNFLRAWLGWRFDESTPKTQTKACINCIKNNYQSTKKHQVRVFLIARFHHASIIQLVRAPTSETSIIALIYIHNR